jgi:antitoxin component YwqK of YwqJK toxin-antitoxin module
MVRQECTYHDNYEIKCSREYVNDILVEEMHFNEQGDKHGTYRGWYPNGNLNFSVTFENGYKNGDLIMYWENGNIQSIRKYSMGNARIEITRYDINGTEIYTQLYPQSNNLILI